MDEKPPEQWDWAPRISLVEMIQRVRSLRIELELGAYYEDGGEALQPEECAAAADLMEHIHNFLRKVAAHPDWVEQLEKEPPGGQAHTG